jgi:multicomponent Na+:H+ antiporter subunit E
MTPSPEHTNAAQEAVKKLPPHSEQLSLRCPLCSTTAPARGVMARNDPAHRNPEQRNPDAEQWELAFICPACGLFTSFAIHRLKAEQIAHFPGSHWASKLRQPEISSHSETSEMLLIDADDRSSHFATTFTACAVLWLLLTGSFAAVDLLWGLVVCLGVTSLSYRFVAFGAPRWMRHPRKWGAFLALAWEFTKQIIVQNISLSMRVFSPQIPIKPGIVAVPYRIRRDVPLTFLISLVTLTPDTVVIDVDEAKSILYIHWIDVKTTEADEAYKLLIRDLEDKVNAWLDDRTET